MTTYSTRIDAKKFSILTSVEAELCSPLVLPKDGRGRPEETSGNGGGRTVYVFYGERRGSRWRDVLKRYRDASANTHALLWADEGESLDGGLGDGLEWGRLQDRVPVDFKSRFAGCFPALECVVSIITKKYIFKHVRDTEHVELRVDSIPFKCLSQYVSISRAAEMVDACESLTADDVVYFLRTDVLPEFPERSILNPAYNAGLREHFRRGVAYAHNMHMFAEGTSDKNGYHSFEGAADLIVAMPGHLVRTFSNLARLETFEKYPANRYLYPEALKFFIIESAVPDGASKIMRLFIPGRITWEGHEPFYSETSDIIYRKVPNYVMPAEETA